MMVKCIVGIKVPNEKYGWTREIINIEESEILELAKQKAIFHYNNTMEISSAEIDNIEL